MNYNNYLIEIKRVIDVLQSTRVEQNIEQVSDLIIATYKKGGLFLIAGNGGSAADAQHIAAEHMGAYLNRSRPAFPAIALTTDTSNVTAISNDFGYDTVFSRQLQAFDQIPYVFLGISTSGDSPNIVQAMEYAKSKKKPTVTLTGGTGGKLKNIADICLLIESTHTPVIQTAHNIVYHWLCGRVEDKYSPEQNRLAKEVQP